MATIKPSASKPTYEELEAENARLRSQLAALKDRTFDFSKIDALSTPDLEPSFPLAPLQEVTALTPPQISRYSRQLLVPYFGTDAQVA